MTVDQLIAEAADLRLQGYSMREIAEQLGSSKSTISRWLQQYDAEQEDLSGDLAGQPQDEEETPAVRPNTRPEPAHASRKGTGDTKLGMGDTELGKLKLDYAHREAMADKGLEARRIGLSEKEYLLKEREQNLVRKEKELRQMQLSQRKQIFVRQFVRLADELLEDCQDCKWDAPDVKQYMSKADKLQHEIEQFCKKKIHADYEELYLWQILNWINSVVAELYEHWQSRLIPGNTILFDLDDQQVEILEDAVELEDFHEQAEEEDEDTDDDYEEGDLDEEELDEEKEDED